MSNIKSVDTVWNTHQDYFGGYPSQSIFLDGTVQVETKLTTLPLRQLFPILKTTFVTHNAILSGYPCTITHNPYFINDGDILKYSDQHYITPKGARQLILNYLMERHNSRYVLYSTQPRNSTCIAENTRIKLKWEDPIEDEWWEGTVALMRTDRFPLSETETNTTIIARTTKKQGNGNTYKDDFITVSNLVNGQKYYIVIATYNKERDMRLNEENKFIVVPQLTYTKVYDKYGNLIAFEPLT